MKKLTIALLALLAFGATEASAQASAAQSATATVTIPSVLAIDVTNTTIAFSPDAAAFMSGYAAGDAPSTIQTRGNVPHDVTVQADAATFTYSGSATPVPAKAASDLEWSLTPGGGGSAGPFTQIDDANPQLLGTYGRGVNAVGSMDYQVAVTYDGDPPGTYTLGFTYTVTAN